MHSSLPNTLRGYLRDNTAPQHERLDRRMSGFDLTTRAGYARFLLVQYQARVGIEDWCALHCPPALRAPSGLPRLRADLADLGRRLPSHSPIFSSEGDPLGVAYVLAGSTLGNTMIARQVRENSSDLPLRFLDDPAAIAHWKLLQPLLKAAPDDTSADVLRGALDTFRHFTALAESAPDSSESLAA